LMTDREPEETIGSAILSHIGSAHIVIADLTYERPNCYYEVGYAHGRDRKVIVTAREDHDPRLPNRQPEHPKVHFDLDSHRVSFWREGEWTTLRTELGDRLSESLRILEVGTTRSARIGDAGESEVMKYLRSIQERSKGILLFNAPDVAQGMGWPVEDVELVLKHLKEKGWIDHQVGLGYSLTSF